VIQEYLIRYNGRWYEDEIYNLIDPIEEDERHK